jgi:branched-chain amino acid transport system permease protein
MDPAGVFATNFSQDQALIRTRKQWIALLLLLLALLLLPLVFGPRLIAISTNMLITAVVVIGLQINMGYAGQINLGQAAFMGVGAYATGVCAAKFGLPFWLSIPLGGCAAAIFGFIFGLSAVRIKGFYLALTTIAAQMLFHSSSSIFRSRGSADRTVFLFSRRNFSVSNSPAIPRSIFFASRSP